jgi:hypothetical protein
MPDANISTVFVLGAGFTKAFLPAAPLLVDDYGGESLRRQFANFPYAAALIEMEMKQADHRPGLINLERLMTRLISEMPHDHRTGSQHVFALIVSELMQSFRKRLSDAKSRGLQNVGELRLFAGHCIGTKSTCLTFNYDDVFDEALWTFNPMHITARAWTPDWGYGFPCRMSESCIRDTPAGIADPESMLLLKLHGSLNWRIPLGYPKPYVIEAIRHHEPWFEHYGHGHDKVDVASLERFLESEPMIIPPVLTKSELNEQPVLRLTWENAISALEKAERVVFLGYSLPITDIAAGFLLREGLDHLPSEAVHVVDFADNDQDRREKRERLLRSYKNVSPTITEEQFEFDGAMDWIRNHLTHWLYDSNGNPIAFESLGWIVSRTGEVIGSRCRRTEVWRRGYRGEIINGNRLLFRASPPTECPGGNEEPPPLPRPERLPGSINSIILPDGYQNIG